MLSEFLGMTHIQDYSRVYSSEFTHTFVNINKSQIQERNYYARIVMEIESCRVLLLGIVIIIMMIMIIIIRQGTLQE